MVDKRRFETPPPHARRADRPDAPLGEGAPANLDIHDLGQPDVPEDDWGDPAGEGATYSANHTRRPVKTEAERGQGRKTRRARKDQISRRV